MKKKLKKKSEPSDSKKEDVFKFGKPKEEPIKVLEPGTLEQETQVKAKKPKEEKKPKTKGKKKGEAKLGGDQPVKDDEGEPFQIQFMDRKEPASKKQTNKEPEPVKVVVQEPPPAPVKEPEPGPAPEQVVEPQPEPPKPPIVPEKENEVDPETLAQQQNLVSFFFLEKSLTRILILN